MVTQDNIHPMTRLLIFLSVRRAERPQDFLTLLEDNLKLRDEIPLVREALK